METLPVDPPFDAIEIEAEAAEEPVHWSELPGAPPRVRRDPMLRELLEPLDEQTFVTEYFGRKVLYSPCRPGRRAHRDILTLEQLLDAIASNRIPIDRLSFLAMKGDKGPPDRFEAENFVVPNRVLPTYDFRRVRDYLANRRGSIAALSIDHWIPSVWRFMAAAGEVTGSVVGANAYYTPIGGRIFTPHWDTHDVLIVQLHGAKRWRVYETLLEHPLGGRRTYMESSSYEGFADDLPFRELTLSEGDLLYLPAGTPHAARSEEQDSLHLTGQIMGPCWHQVLTDMVAHALRECEKELPLRRPCPAWFLGADDPRVEAARSAVLERFTERMRAVSLSEVFDRHFAGQLPMPVARAISASEVELDTPLVRTPGVAFVHEADAAVDLVFLEQRLRFPVETAPALRWLLERSTLRAAELPGLREGARRRLARQLVDEGFLRPE